MKKIVMTSMLAGLSAVFCSCHRNQDLNIKVKDSDDKYTFSAYFNEDKMPAVQSYINRSISPNSLFAAVGDRVNIDTRLLDGTVFELEASPGELVVKVDKSENKPASVQRIRRMCEGIKGVIMD
ncbi:hypothetical protein [Dyadobacter sp. 32]|uniref:hypothetical protein n=1 Tax=Dyadobacter sp. 32 TaxID=538966 RepID=UPI0011EC91D5